MGVEGTHKRFLLQLLDPIITSLFDNLYSNSNEVDLILKCALYETHSLLDMEQEQG